jgi:lipopolysaccharide biosynthesis glycosyltransferase
MRVYIGYDPREHEAYAVARASLIRRQPSISVHSLRLARLQDNGLYTRPMKMVGGQRHDVISGAQMSTDFAISRFFIPVIEHCGWALFVDCDVVFLEDVKKILEGVSEDKAVYVVKHDYSPTSVLKMDNQIQTTYSRKNWSSVMLINCCHPAHRRLTLTQLNHLPVSDLHKFCWLHDEEIGELDAGWNWLVNEQPKPPSVKIAHFTLGGPWLPDWKAQPNDEIWLEERRHVL